MSEATHIKMVALFGNEEGSAIAQLKHPTRTTKVRNRIKEIMEESLIPDFESLSFVQGGFIKDNFITMSHDLLQVATPLSVIVDITHKGNNAYTMTLKVGIAQTSGVFTTIIPQLGIVVDHVTEGNLDKRVQRAVSEIARHSASILAL